MSSVRSSFHIRHTASGAPDEQLVGEHEGEVADEDGDTLAEAPRLPRPAGAAVLVGVHRVSGGGAAPSGGVVHHVVVEQGERVHQLERGAGVEDARVVALAARADEAPVAERRAEPLAARRHHPLDLLERTGQVDVDRRPAITLGAHQRDEALVDAGRQDAERRGGRPAIATTG